MPDTQEKSPMPRLVDVYHLLTIEDMIAEDDAQISVTKERFLARPEAIHSDIAEFQRTVRRDFVKLLTPATDVLGAVGDADQDMDFDLLQRASSLFRCPYACRSLLPFSALFTHNHVKNSSYSWSQLKHRVRPNMVTQTVLAVLNIFGVPENATVTALGGLDGKCVCLCGHPDFRTPMTFSSLVRFYKKLFMSSVVNSLNIDLHLVDENRWYQN
jgi:hypothetical protein